MNKMLKRLLTNPTSLTGILLLLAFAVTAVAAPWIAPPPENARDPYMIPRDGFSIEPAGPSPEHPLGTTEGQYDILYGVVWGTRTAFRVGVMIAAFTTLIGVSVGSLAAFYGGMIDEVLMRVTEIFQAFPFLLAAITMTSVLQTIYGRRAAGPLMFVAKVMALLAFGRNPTKPVDPIQLRILTAMLAITVFGWMTYARVIRGTILSVKEKEYALAARSIGAGNMRILFRHLLPNAIFPVIVIASMRIGSYVLTFAGLSFLGLGVPITEPSLGSLINEGYQVLFSGYWWITIFPGLGLMLIVLGINQLGDRLRDVLNPRLKR